jgi:hypothetical protein
MDSRTPDVRKVEPSEILDLIAYEKVRPEFMARIIELKRPRRITVGDRLTFIFENRDTVIFQIQEMTRAERRVSPEAIAEEVDVYNELVPGRDELSATLMIEIPDSEEIRPELNRLIGIDEHVLLDVGGEKVRAQFDDKQFEEERISAVQYVRFPLGAALAQAVRDRATRVVLKVDHPAYEASQCIDGASRASLVADLEAGD